jgi:hypothetical protein
MREKKFFSPLDNLARTMILYAHRNQEESSSGEEAP